MTSRYKAAAIFVLTAAVSFFILTALAVALLWFLSKDEQGLGFALTIYSPALVFFAAIAISIGFWSSQCFYRRATRRR